MTTDPKPNRREFIRNISSAGAGLILAINLPRSGRAFSAAPAKEFAPSAYLSISPDNKITIWVTRSEMGQGVRTALPMMIADELEADWKTIVLKQASSGGKFAGIRLRTSGSGSIYGTWTPLRTAGAAARTMLKRAAASRWRVPEERLRAENGRIVDKETGMRLTYGELCEEAAGLPVPENPKLKSPSEFRYIGKRVLRVDSPDIVTGRAIFGQDLSVPGMKHAVIEHAPRFGGKPLKWNEEQVLAIPGVRTVVPVTLGIKQGIAVVADTLWTAMKARDELKVSWEYGTDAEFSTDAYRTSLQEALKGTGYRTREEGDPDTALRNSRKTLSAVYEYPFQSHSPLETMNCIARFDKDLCEVWSGTQTPDVASILISRQFGFPEDKITVHTPLIGGGFGRRLFADQILETVEIANSAGVPVKVFWTRADDTRDGFFQPFSICEMKASVEDGSVKAVTHRTASSDHSMSGPPLKDLKRYIDLLAPWGAYDSPYLIPAYRAEYFHIDAPVPTGPWRAVWYPQNVFARECFLDEIAAELGKDPLEFRMELLDGPDLDLNGTIIRRKALRNVLKLAAAKAGWGSPTGARRGRGIACNIYRGASLMAQIAEVSVNGKNEIKVDRIVCAVECGQVVNPLGLEGQIESGIVWGLSAALKGEITFKNGAAEQSSYGDFDVLRMNEMPVVEVFTVPSTERPQGIGEPPVVPVAPAVSNAVFAATGKRLRKLPLRL
ncbi:MAG: xanthine dehydrogenase family protein molybdopterin-binding subunit [Acidobacteriota bacterium]|nr:MAG: xanthine dehydrogenase family protein molybdopterin-binding subunit [Acidobacteriota bacterium]